MPNNTQQKDLFSKEEFDLSRNTIIPIDHAMELMKEIAERAEGHGFFGDFCRVSQSLKNIANSLFEVTTGDVLNLDEHAKTIEDGLNLVIDSWNTCVQQYNDQVNKKSKEEKEAYAYIQSRMERLSKDMDSVSSLLASFKKFNQYLNRVSDENEIEQEKQSMLNIADRITLTDHCPTIPECVAMKPENMTAIQILERLFWLFQHQVEFQLIDDAKPDEEKEVSDKSVYGYAFRRLHAYIGRCDFAKQEELAEAYYRLKFGLHMKAEQKYREILAGIPDGPEKEVKALIMLAETKEYSAFKSVEAMINYIGEVVKACGSLSIKPVKEKVREKDFFAAYSGMLRDRQEGPVERAEGVLIKYSKSEDLNKAAIGREAMARISERARERFMKTGGTTNIRSKIAETYCYVMSDKREASDSFKSMKNSLRRLLMRNPENETNPEIYLKNLEEAKKKAQEYLDSHKGYRFRDKGKERVAWAKALKRQLAELSEDPVVKNLSVNYRQNEINKAAERIRNDLDTIRRQNRQNNIGGVDNLEDNIREEYAKMLYHQSQMQKPLIPEKEEARFYVFLHSKKLAAAFALRNVHSMKNLVERENLTENLKKEIQLVNEHDYLDKIPMKKNAGHGQVADKYIAWKQLDQDAFTRRLFFTDFIVPTKDSPNHIEGIEHGSGRLGLSVGRQALDTLALGVMLDKGYTFDEAMDVYGFQNARSEAGRKVLDEYRNTKDDKKFADFCGKKFYAVLKKLIDYVDNTIAKMDGISLDKMTDPKYSNLYRAMNIIQDAAQELDRDEISKWKEDNNKDELDKLIEKQLAIAGTLGCVKTESLLQDAVDYDVHVNRATKRTCDSDVCSKLNCYFICEFVDKEMKKNPGKRFTEVVTPGEETDSLLSNMNLLRAKKNFPCESLNKAGVNGSFAQALIYGQKTESLKLVPIVGPNGEEKVKIEGLRDIVNQSKDEVKKLTKKIGKVPEVHYEEVVFDEIKTTAPKNLVIGR